MAEPVEVEEDATARPHAAGFGSLGSIIGLLFLTWAAGLASRPLNDNSFFTHLATGRLILDRGSVPTRDPYTFTATGEPWTVQSWLVSVALAGAERLGGPVGVRLLLIGTYLVAAWLIWRLTGSAPSILVRLGLAAGAMFVATGLWSERPYMVGVIGLALVWLALEGAVPWWLLLPVMWVWGNSHGSFLFALVLAALVLVGGALDRGWRQRSPVPPHEWRAAVAIAAGTLLVAVGPLGLRALTFPFVAVRRSGVFGRVAEWQAPAFRSTSELAYLALLAAVVLILARRGAPWRVVLPAIGFGVASLYAQRNVVLATVVLVAAASRSAPVIGTLRSRDRPRGGNLVAGIVVALLVVVSSSTSQAPAGATDDYAARPIAWIGTDSMDLRIATDVADGNLLEVLDGPRATVFVDDRFDMLPNQLFADLLVLKAGRIGWHQALERWDVGAVVWSATSPLAAVLRASPDWVIVYSDAAHVVACARNGQCPFVEG